MNEYGSVFSPHLSLSSYSILVPLGVPSQHTPFQVSHSPLLTVGLVAPHQPSYPAALGSQTFSLIKSDSSRHPGMLLLPMTHAGSRAAWLPQATRNVARTGKQGSIAKSGVGVPRRVEPRQVAGPRLQAFCFCQIASPPGLQLF